MNRKKRGNSVLDALQAFQTTYGIAKNVQADIDKAGLSEAMQNATTEEKSTVAEVNTPDAQNYTKDSETGNYAPSLAAVQSGVSDTLKPIVEPQYETKTERVDKQFASPADKRTAMLQAGIDYWTKKGDTDKALDLQDKMEQGTLRKMQVKSAMREDKKGDAEEKDREDYRLLSEGFSGAKIYKENAAALADYERQNAAHQEALKTNPEAAGPAPVKPTLRAVTAMDQLKDASQHMQFNIARGKVSPVEALQFQQMVTQVKKEVGTEALKLLHAGDIQGAVKAFESQGEMKIPEGAQITSRKGVYEVAGQKVPTNELVVTLPNGRIQVFNGLQGLDALDSADKVINTAFKGAELKLKDKEIGIHGAGLALRQEEGKRAQERWGIEKTELVAKAGDSKAQRVARQGLMDAISSGDDKAVEKAKQVAIAAGVKLEKPQMEYTTVIDQMGNRAIITDKDKGSARVIDLQSGATKNLSAPGQPANVSFANEAEAQRALKDGKIKAGDTVMIGGRAARVN